MNLLTLVSCQQQPETYVNEKLADAETVHGIKMKRAVSSQNGALENHYNRILQYASGEGSTEGLKYLRYVGDVNGDGYQDELRWIPNTEYSRNDLKKMSLEVLRMCSGEMYYGTASGNFAKKADSFYSHDGTLRRVGQIVESFQTVVSDPKDTRINGAYTINTRIDTFGVEPDYQTNKIVNGLPPHELGVSVEMYVSGNIVDVQGKHIAAFESGSNLDAPHFYAKHPEGLIGMIHYGGDAVPVKQLP